jgi:DNA-binding NarL/FixJ family response regulator
MPKPKTVLIADDNAMVRGAVRQAIEQDIQFTVCVEAADGTEAVSKAKVLSPDLIILDVRMPGLNGVEVAGILRYAQPKIRIILVTMYAGDFPLSLAPVLGVSGVFDKVNGLAEMIALAKSLLYVGQGGPDVQ